MAVQPVTLGREILGNAGEVAGFTVIIRRIIGLHKKLSPEKRTAGEVLVHFTVVVPTYCV